MATSPPTGRGALPIARPRPGACCAALRVVRRGVGVLLWTLVCMPIQAVCLMLPGRPKVVFARFYWSMVSRLLGLQVRVIGRLAATAGGRPVVFVSNHSSWLDVPVLGGRLDACFVSKDEVGALAVRRHHRAARPDRLRLAPARRDRPRARRDARRGWPPATTCCCSRRAPRRTDRACCRSARRSSRSPRAPIRR